MLDNLSNSSPEALRRVGELAGHQAQLHVADLLDAEATGRIFAAGAPRGRHPLRRIQGRRRIRREAAEVLPQQRRRHPEPARGHGRPRRPHAGLQLLGHRLRRRRGVPITEERRWPRPTPTGGPSCTSSRCSTTSPPPTRAGPSPCCATSTRSAPTRPGASARTRRAIPNNLMPFVAQVAVGRREKLQRLRRRLPDAGRHRRARLHPRRRPGRRAPGRPRIPAQARGACTPVNLGSGTRLLRARRRARPSPAPPAARSPTRSPPAGRATCAEYFADPALAREQLGWKSERGLEEMCRRRLALAVREPGGLPPAERTRAGSRTGPRACAGGPEPAGNPGRRAADRGGRGGAGAGRGDGRGGRRLRKRRPGPRPPRGSNPCVLLVSLSMVIP